jgi:hypothetical protein
MTAVCDSQADFELSGTAKTREGAALTHLVIFFFWFFVSYYFIF